MTKPVTVVDYGLGNLHSVLKALRHAGAEVRLTEDPGDVERAERLVLPGVGAFADGVEGLRSRGLIEPLKGYIATGRPFLGICVGMQLLMTEGTEFGRHLGLDVIPGRVVEIAREPGLKVPHVGWNRLQPVRQGGWAGSALAGLTPGEMVYFVHSFTAVPDREEDRLADAEYGANRLSAAVQKDNVLGCQFHPEKSGAAGLAILTAFLAA